MTNKEVIMVNDVDGSECHYLFGEDTCSAKECSNTQYYYCKDNTQCYYKQLKRTEQQLEAKDKEVNKYKDITNKALDDKDKLLDKVLLKDKEIEYLKGKLNVAMDILNTMVNGYHFTSDIEGHFKELAQQVLKQIESEI